jgi:hypothetical protein
LFCAYDRILRFSHIYCQLFSRVPFVDGSDVPLNSECINFNDRVRKAPNNYYFGAIFWNHGQEKKKLPVDRYISFSHRLLMITTNLIKYLPCNYICGLVVSFSLGHDFKILRQNNKCLELFWPYRWI